MSTTEKDAAKRQRTAARKAAHREANEAAHKRNLQIVSALRLEGEESPSKLIRRNRRARERVSS